MSIIRESFESFENDDMLFESGASYDNVAEPEYYGFSSDVREANLPAPIKTGRMAGLAQKAHNVAYHAKALKDKAGAVVDKGLAYARKNPIKTGVAVGAAYYGARKAYQKYKGPNQYSEESYKGWMYGY